MPLLGRRADDLVDRDVAAVLGDRRLLQLARAAQPLLDHAQERGIATVLEGDADAGQMRGERPAGQDVPVVLQGVAVDDEPPVRRELRVVESFQAESLEPQLAGFARRRACGAAFRAANTRRTRPAAR